MIHPHQVLPSRSYTFEEAIWKVLPCTRFGQIVWALELRNQATKQVRFVLAEAENEQVSWQTPLDRFDFWTSISAHLPDCLVLSSYRHPDIPQPTDCHLLSTSTGDILYEFPGFTYITFAPPATIYVASTGSVEAQMSTFDLTTQLFTKAEALDLPLQATLGDIQYPSRYYPADMYFDELQAFLLRTLSVTAPFCIDYMEFGDKMILGYFIKSDELICQYLCITDVHLTLFLHTKIGESTQGIARETIIRYQNTLAYVVENSTFVTIQLAP